MQADLNKYIEIREKRDGRLRPFVAGTQIEIQYLVKDHEWQDMDAEEIASHYERLSISQVHAALAFYHDNRDAIRQIMRDDEALVNSLSHQAAAAS